MRNYDDVMTHLRSDEASRSLLLAYAFATRQRMFATPEGEQDSENSQTYYGRGTSILWSRLADRRHASSDSNIQAVLLLVAYTSDFGQPNEVEIHANALRAMVTQRGGVDSFAHSPPLQHQISAIETSRTFHLTLLCGTFCPSPRRFPPGFWT